MSKTKNLMVRILLPTILILLMFYGISKSSEIKTLDFRIIRINCDPILGSDLCTRESGCKLDIVLEIYWSYLLDRGRERIEEYYERNTPILWIYKNGIKVEEATLNDIDPEKLCVQTGSCLHRVYVSKAPLLTGDFAHIKVVVDPLNIFHEGTYYDDQQRTSLEGDNEWEGDLTIEKVTFHRVNCPMLVGPGGEVSVLTKITNFYCHPVIRLFLADLVFEMRLSTDDNISKQEGNIQRDGRWTEDEIIDEKEYSLEYNRSYDIELKGKIPSDTPPGSYKLIISAHRRGDPRNIDKYICPVRVEPTAQQIIKEKAGKGELPPKSAPPLEKAKEIALMSYPDLTIARIEETRDCGVEITIKNLAAPLQDSVYQSNPVLLRIVEDFGPGRTLDSYTLNQADPQKVLKNTNGEVKIRWKPPAGVSLDHPFKFIVDPDRAILESNEGNNVVSRKITCTQGTKKEVPTRLPVVR